MYESLLTLMKEGFSFVGLSDLKFAKISVRKTEFNTSLSHKPLIKQISPPSNTYILKLDENK